jgi:hypothetical protein
LGSVAAIVFQTRKAYSSFDLISVKYNVHTYERDEKAKVTREQINKMRTYTVAMNVEMKNPEVLPRL